MARRRQTELAVLGALSVEPMTGYAVREAIRDVLGHFWSESFGQIYPTLAALVDEGHATKQVGVAATGGGGGRTGASTFAITGTGLAHLRELLTAPIQPSRPRDGLLLRLFFGRHLGADACRDLLLDARAQAEVRLQGFEAIRAEIEAETGTENDRAYWLITLSSGEHAARTTIAWVDESLQALDRSAS